MPLRAEFDARGIDENLLDESETFIRLKGKNTIIETNVEFDYSIE